MNLRVMIFGVIVLISSGCSKEVKDTGIKKMIATKAKSEMAFAGINYSINNGVVTLTGNCPTEKERTEVESKVKQTAGVKKVINNIVVAPVVLNGEHLLKRSVDSVMMKHPALQATVQDSIIYLQGTIEMSKVKKIINDLQKLGPIGISGRGLNLK